MCQTENGPIVWLSLNQSWKPTANKVWQQDGRLCLLTREQTEALGGGLVRIGVAPETAPHDWQALKELSGMSSETAQSLYNAAIKKGSRPGQWRGTFDAVPRSQWIAVEVVQDGSSKPSRSPFSASAQAIGTGMHRVRAANFVLRCSRPRRSRTRSH